MLRSSPFHPSLNLSLSLSIFSHRDGRVLDTVRQHSRDIQYVSVQNLDFCSYNFHNSRFRDLVHVKVKLMCIALFPNIVQITMCFFCRNPLSHLAIDALSSMKL